MDYVDHDYDCRKEVCFQGWSYCELLPVFGKTGDDFHDEDEIIPFLQKQLGELRCKVWPEPVEESRRCTPEAWAWSKKYEEACTTVAIIRKFVACLWADSIEHDYGAPVWEALVKVKCNFTFLQYLEHLLPVAWN